MAKIKIDNKLYDRAKLAAQAAGYSSVEEFILHIIEKEVAGHESGQVDEKVADRLRGLGYID